MMKLITFMALLTLSSASSSQSLEALYTIINDTGIYKAIDAEGATAYSSTDPGSVLQSAIDDAQNAGGQIVFRSGDTFTYTSIIPAFRPNKTEWVSIVGHGATIELTATAYRAFDFDKQADFDVFGRIRLEGFTVDANLVNTSNFNHVLLGFLKDNSRARNVSLDGIIVKDVRVLNVFADGSGADHAVVLHLSPFCSRGAAQEPYLKNISVAGMEIRGGEAGIAVTVSDLGSSGAYKCFIENVYIRENSIALGKSSGETPPDEFYASTGIFVGGDVRFTRNVHISDNSVRHAGDNCYEVSAPLGGVSFHNNACIDPYHVGLTLNNFPSAGDPDGDGVFGEENLEEFELTVSDFSVRYNTYVSGTTPRHRGISVNNTSNSDSPFGYLRISNLSYVDISGDETSSAIIAVNKWTHISVNGLRDFHFDIDYDEAASPSTPAHTVFKNSRAGGSVTLRDVHARFDGEYDAVVEAGGNDIYSRLFQFQGEDLDIDVENVRVETNLRNFDDANDKFTVFEIGHNGVTLPSGHATMSGRIANVEVIDETSAPDDNPHLIRFGSGLVVDDDLFFVDNVNARGLTDSTNLLFFDDPKLERRADRVFVSRLRPSRDALLVPLPARRWDYVELMEECVEFSNGNIGNFGRCPDYKTIRDGTGDCTASNQGDSDPLSAFDAISTCRLSTGTSGGVAGINVLQVGAENTKLAGLNSEKMRQFAARVQNKSATTSDADFVVGGIKTSTAKDISTITDGAYWVCGHGESAQNWLAVVENGNQRSIYNTGDNCFDNRFKELVIEYDETENMYEFYKDGTLQTTFDCTTDNCPTGESLATWAAVLDSSSNNWKALVDYIYYRGRR